MSGTSVSNHLAKPHAKKRKAPARAEQRRDAPGLFLTADVTAVLEQQLGAAGFASARFGGDAVRSALDASGDKAAGPLGIVWSGPERGIVAALLEGADPALSLENWCAEAEQVVGLFRRFRRKLVLINDNSFADPSADAEREAILQRFDLSGMALQVTREPTSGDAREEGGVSAAHAAAMTWLTRVAITHHPRLKGLLAELSASSIIPLRAADVAKVGAVQAFAALSALHEEGNRLRGAAELATQEMVALTQRHEQELRASRSELDALRLRSEEREGEFAEEARALNVEIAALQEERDAVREERDLLRRQAELAMRELAALHEEGNRLRGAAELATQEMVALTQRHEQELRASRSELDALRLRSEEREGEFAEEARALNVEIAALQEERDAVREERDLLREQILLNIKDLDDLDASARACCASVEELTVKLDRQSDKLTALTDENAALQGNLIAYAARAEAEADLAMQGFDQSGRFMDLIERVTLGTGVERSDGVIKLSATSAQSHGIYGPYLTLAPGKYEVCVAFSMTPRGLGEPVAVIEVVHNVDDVLAMRRFEGSKLKSQHFIMREVVTIPPHTSEADRPEFELRLWTDQIKQAEVGLAYVRRL